RFVYALLNLRFQAITAKRTSITRDMRFALCWGESMSEEAAKEPATHQLMQSGMINAKRGNAQRSKWPALSLTYGLERGRWDGLAKVQISASRNNGMQTQRGRRHNIVGFILSSANRDHKVC